MKHKNLLRVTAMLLSLLMIVPMLGSVISFAESPLSDGEKTLLYYANYDDGSLKLNGSNGAITVAGVPGSTTDKAMKLAMWGSQIGSGAQFYGGHIELDMPEISYETYDKVVFEFDFYVAEGDGGVVNLWVSKEIGITANGTKKTGADTGLLVRLDFRGETGKFTAGSSSTAASFAKGQWHSASALVDLDAGTVKGYLDGSAVSESGISISGISSPKNLIFHADSVGFLSPWGDRDNALSANLLIDEVKIYEYVAPQNPTIYSADYDDGNLKLNQTNGAFTAVNVPGSTTNKAMQIYMWGDSTGGSNAQFYGARVEFDMPQISYETYDTVAFEFDFYVPETDGGVINLMSSRDVPITANGTTSKSNTFTSTLVRLDFRGETGTFKAGDSGATATFAKGEWYSVAAIVNLDAGTVRGYLDGEFVSESAISVSGISNPKNFIFPADSLCFTAPWGDRVNGYSAKPLIDNFKISDYDDPMLYYANYDNGSLKLNQNNGAITAVNVPGSTTNKAMQIAMWGSQVGSGAQFYGGRTEMQMPALSYETTPQVAIEFDFFVAEGDGGVIQLSGTRDIGVTASGVTKNNTEQPVLLFLDFRNETGTFKAGASGATVNFKKGEWHSAVAFFDLKNGTVKGYLDGDMVSESALSVSGVSNPKNFVFPADGLAFVAPWGNRDHALSANLLIDNVNIFKCDEYVVKKKDGTLANGTSAEELTLPEISYVKYDKAIFDMDAFIPEDADGSFSVSYSGGKADTIFLTGAKYGQQAFNALELFHIDYTADSDTAILSSAANVAKTAGALKKGEVNRISAAVDLNQATVTAYVNGIEAFNAPLTVVNEAGVAGASPTNLTLGANGLTFVGGEDVTVDNINVYGMIDKTYSKQTVEYPSEDANGNALNYVLYGEQKISGATAFFAPTEGICTPVYFESSAYEDLITTVDAASIRLGAPTDESALKTTSGIRFATEINDIDRFDALMAMKENGELADVTFGTLIAPADYLTEQNLTKELSEDRYLDVKADYGKYFAFDNDAETTHFVGSIANLYTANLGRTFAARGYVEITLISGEVITVYGDVVERSIKQVAAGLLADSSYTWSDDEYAQLDRYSKVADWGV